MLKTSPTKLSLRRQRAAGYWCTVVEYYNWKLKRRFDLCACDILCLCATAPPLLVQTTDVGDLPRRVEKILANEGAMMWCASGGRIEAHGWKPLTKTRRKYMARVVTIGLSYDVGEVRKLVVKETHD